jgi:uncharacterized membrane protein
MVHNIQSQAEIACSLMMASLQLIAAAAPLLSCTCVIVFVISAAIAPVPRATPIFTICTATRKISFVDMRLISADWLSLRLRMVSQV